MTNEEQQNEPDAEEKETTCSKGDLVCPKMLSDNTIVTNTVRWKSLKNMMVDIDLNNIKNFP